MKNAMFSVHKSEYSASKMNISRSEEELFIFFILKLGVKRKTCLSPFEGED